MTPTTKTRTFRTFLLQMELAREEIVQRIAQAREEAGLTQAEAAELLGVHKRTIENWEHVRVPWRDMNRLADAYGRSLEWFLHGDVEPRASAEVSEQLDRIERVQAEQRKADRQTQRLLQELLARLAPSDEARDRSAS